METEAKVDKILEKLKTLGVLYQLRQEFTDKLDKCNMENTNEYEYCAISSRIETLNEVINSINLQIKELI